MTMLLQAQPDAALLTVYGESILHLCVKHYKLEALKFLVKTINDPEIINSKDTDGNTILHLAVADKQVETINFLLSVAMNALNLEGMTAVDVLIRSRRDVRDSFIKESLKHAGGLGALETNIPILDQNRKITARVSTPHHDHSTSSITTKNNSREGLFKQQDDWLEKKRSALMIVASLIATMAFQAGINPPNGVWQDDKLDSSHGHHLVPDSHKAGLSVLARNHPVAYMDFCIANTIGFIASLCVILLLMSGLPLRRRLCMWILMVITWIAITAMALTYLVSLTVLTPSLKENPVLYLIVVSIKFWLCLMAFLLIGHTIRLAVNLVRKRRKRTEEDGYRFSSS